MSDPTPFGRDKAAKNLADLVAKMEASGRFGKPVSQSGGNGPEILFRCPLCADDSKDSKGRMLRVARRIDGGDLPYVGCRTHDSPELWRELRARLGAAGVPDRLLKPASGDPSVPERPSRSPLPGSGRGFPDRPDGLGESEPVPAEQVDVWVGNLAEPPAKKYRKYLTARGLSAETIEYARLGLGQFTWTVGKRPNIRLTIPIFNADGEVVNVRLAGISAGSNRMPLPHPEQIRVDSEGADTNKYETYGSPARLYGVDELAAAQSASEGSDWAFVMAGEWDRLLAWQCGLLAVSGTGGEGSLPRRADAEYLLGMRVVVVYDCDDAGRRGALKFATACAALGVDEVRIVDLDPAREDGYDFADLVAEAGDVEAGERLMELATAAPLFTPDPADLAAAAAPPWELSDYGVAEQIAWRDSETLRYVTESATWIGWNADLGVWDKFPTRDLKAPTDAIISYVRETRAELRDAEDESAEANWAKFLHGYLFSGRCSSAIKMLAGANEVRVRVSEIDARPNLLNTANGTLDLLSGDLRDAVSDDLITKRTHGAILLDGAPETEGERVWSRILERSVPNPGTRLALQQVCGIALLDGNPLQVMVFLLGGTGTGKSVFAELFMYALGDYAGSFNLSMFRDNQDEKPRADLVRALTQRAIFASEASEQWRLHTDQIKRLTGEDSITARLPHSGEYVERMPAFMPWFRTNQAPHIETPDLALYRRLLVFPFEQPYSAQGKRTGVGGGFVLRTRDLVADAVLTWAVEGLFDWQDSGGGEIEKSGEMVRAELALREALNDTQAFLAEETEPDTGSRVAFKELYDRYVNWAFEAGLTGKDVLSKKAFGDRLSGLGYQRKDSNSITWRMGLSFRKKTREVR